MNTREIIYPHGVGMFIILGISLAFVVGGIIVFIESLIEGSDINSWISTVAGFGGMIIGTLMCYQYIFHGRVIFDGDRFISVSEGADRTIFPPINIDCKDIVSFEQGGLKRGVIEFTKADGRKIDFFCLSFSTKQRMRILEEIRKRGGLQGQIWDCKG